MPVLFQGWDTAVNKAANAAFLTMCVHVVEEWGKERQLANRQINKKNMS